MGLGNLGAFAVAIQAKAQMCLKCSGKGQHLQEGRGQPLLHLIPQACPFSPELICSPYLSGEHSIKSGSSCLGALRTRSCSYVWLSGPNWDLCEKEAGRLGFSGVVRVGISSSGLIAHRAEVWGGAGMPWYLDTEP